MSAPAFVPGQRNMAPHQALRFTWLSLLNGKNRPMKPAELFLGLILAVAGCAQFGSQEIRPFHADRAVRGRLGTRERHQHGERNRPHEGRRHEP